MHNDQLHSAISAPRFNRYLIACEGNRQKAEQLYRANLRLSEKMYSVIGMLEIILRNSIDRHFVRRKGTNWLEDAVSPGGYLDISPGCEETFHSVHDVIYKLGTAYTHDELVAKLSFGFWTYQFAAKQFSASGSSLLDVFPRRPKGTRQKDIFKSLFNVTNTRNRIAHYEPICFNKKTGTISCDSTEKSYSLIVDLLAWLGCPHKKVLEGIDGVQPAIAEINDI